MRQVSLLPSLRSRVGDWNFYVTTLTFMEVAQLIKAPDEIHERRKLGEWIQREAIQTHAEAIASYILDTPQRFLGSLIVGVYGGSPDWTPLSVHSTETEVLTSEQADRIEGRLGLLRLSGSENLFAIDGQHRVAGIKVALQRQTELVDVAEDCVSAIFVAHDPLSAAGKERTRRLFTTVNKKARVISKAAKIALDEDDGFAIVTRKLIDFHSMFDDSKKFLLFASGGAIPARDSDSITTVVGLFEIVRALYGSAGDFDRSRPTDEEIASHLARSLEFFDELVEQVPEINAVVRLSTVVPGDYRHTSSNHMLFRPAGQQTFARAVQLLLSRGLDMHSAVGVLSQVDLFLNGPQWHHIMWNPVTQTMISNRASIAEAQLLRLSGQPLRSTASGVNLDKLLASIPSET